MVTPLKQMYAPCGFREPVGAGPIQSPDPNRPECCHDALNCKAIPCNTGAGGGLLGSWLSGLRCALHELWARRTRRRHKKMWVVQPILPGPSSVTPFWVWNGVLVGIYYLSRSLSIYIYLSIHMRYVSSINP